MSTTRIRFDLDNRAPPESFQMWQSLAEELGALVSNPNETTLVVTDTFAKIVSELESAVPWRFGPREAGDYSPDKPDGARAGGQTLQLENGSVVVIDAVAEKLGEGCARRLVHHEAGHVRLRENDEMAWAAHRRWKFARPSSVRFEFLYMVESMIDEYRCEAALAGQVAAAADMTVAPGGYGDIEAIFDRVRAFYRRTGDLAATPR
jgi:hypothetical protein